MPCNTLVTSVKLVNMVTGLLKGMGKGLLFREYRAKEKEELHTQGNEKEVSNSKRICVYTMDAHS